MREPVVSVIKTEPEPDEQQIIQAVREAVELAGGLEGLFKPGDLVLINPNLVAVPPQRRGGAVTLKEVCKGVAVLVEELGGKPFIAESSAAGVDTEKVIEATGYQELRDEGYEVVDLKKDKTVTMKVPAGYVLEEITTFELVQKAAAIISVPVMKTHDQAEASLSIKNLKGLISDELKKDFHRVYSIFEGVPALMAALKPSFAVVDAIVAQEGLGPIFGLPVGMNTIVAGRDLVAVDSISCQLMDIAEDEMFMEKNAADKGLGVIDRSRIKVVGEDVAALSRRFMRAVDHVIIEEPTFNLLFEEGTCTGCRNTVLSSLVDIKNDNLQEYLKNKTVIAGQCNSVPDDVDPEGLILVGVCTRDMKAKGKYVKGCPPNNIWVVQAIVGEGKAKRQYATEDIDD